jgi:trigger factor
LKSTIHSIQSWKKKLDIEVPWEEVEPYLEKAMHAYQKKVRMDGFRKGKVPMAVVQKTYGKAIQAEVADELVQVFFREAVERESLPIVSPGSVQEVDFQENQPFRFSVEVEVEPEFQVTDYKGFKVEKEIQKITQEDVKSTLQMLQEQRAEHKDVAGGAEPGHIVEGDVQALDSSGVPIIGKKWEDRSFELGAPPLGDMIQDQLMGVKKGEERRFSLVQPRKQPDGGIMETKDHYSISVKSIKEKILPKLDDGFASDIGEFESMDQLEKDIKSRLEAQREDEAERSVRNRIRDEVIRRNTFDLPPSMVQNALDRLWEDYRREASQEVSREKFDEENRAGVIWNLKWQLIWPVIAGQESLEVTAQEVDAEIEKIVQSAEKDQKRIRSLFKDPERRRRVEMNIHEERVIAFLKEQNKIREVVLKPSKKGKSPIITS